MYLLSSLGKMYICTRKSMEICSKSATAKAFADKFGVQVSIKVMGKYPQIRCNINNGNKVYHLPFDQQ